MYHRSKPTILSFFCAAVIVGLIGVLLPSLLVAQPASIQNLDNIVSSKPLGCMVTPERTTFRLFAPRATAVWLVIFADANDTKGREIPMKPSPPDAATAMWDGTWEHTEQAPSTALYGKLYCYRVSGTQAAHETFNPAILVADPYSRAVVSTNTFPQRHKTLILDPNDNAGKPYDWQGDKWVVPANHNALVIYEAHLRDMTAHASSGVRAKGTFKGMTELGKRGGLSYLKQLGVNAVEFLPLHEFNNLEIPYKDSSTLKTFGQYNDYNLYARNHWGYMTSFYFAPESYYASDGSLAPKNQSGAQGKAVREMKDMVKALHNEGIAVILDVVYNHTSEFEYNPFKLIDKFYYYRTDSAGKLINTSYCGNDFKTERAMARRLIIESVKYWMTEYHIDGFRFDLAAMLDWETCEAVRQAAQTINPNVILIAEPWGGGKYAPAGFSQIGWASWNDHIRNGVKGQNPNDGLGFIFGKMQGSNTKRSLQAFINGTLKEDGGLFLQKEHSVNYLESHDDETMGDFIRLGLGELTMNTVVKNVNTHAKLSPAQRALNKLAAMFLFASQGPVMIHAGQEYARSKVIAPVAGAKIKDPNTGKLDRNSYNKDNATNYLDYAHAALNSEIVQYYQGLIALRKRYPMAFGSATKDAIEFLDTDNDCAIAFRIMNRSAEPHQPKSFVVLLNGNRTAPLSIQTPKGKWSVLANGTAVSPTKPLGSVAGGATVQIPSSTGWILAEED
jgi:pullulanase/glycogen debranching enzyme